MTNKLAHPYENFNNIHDQKKPVTNLEKEDFFSKLKKSPGDDEI